MRHLCVPGVLRVLVTLSKALVSGLPLAGNLGEFHASRWLRLLLLSCGLGSRSRSRNRRSNRSRDFVGNMLVHVRPFKLEFKVFKARFLEDLFVIPLLFPPEGLVHILMLLCDNHIFLFQQLCKLDLTAFSNGLETLLLDFLATELCLFGSSHHRNSLEVDTGWVLPRVERIFLNARILLL